MSLKEDCFYFLNINDFRFVDKPHFENDQFYPGSIVKIKKETKMNIFSKEDLDQLDNSDLQQQSRNCNGALYTRINRLQRDLNIANAEVEKFKTLYNDISARFGNHGANCQYKDQLEAIKNTLGILVKQI